MEEALKLHEFVDKFHEDMAFTAPELWAERLAWFLSSLKDRYADVAEADYPKPFVLRWESPDFEHPVIAELRERPGEWAVIQVTGHNANEATYHCKLNEARIEMKSTPRAVYVRYRPDEEMDAGFTDLLGGGGKAA